MLHLHLKACPKCHGDLALDEGDWLCLQCGTYYYTRLYRNSVSNPTPKAGIEGQGCCRRENDVKLKTFAAGGVSRYSAETVAATAFGVLPGFQSNPTSGCRFGETATIGLGGGDRPGP